MPFELFRYAVSLLSTQQPNVDQKTSSCLCWCCDELCELCCLIIQKFLEQIYASSVFPLRPINRSMFYNSANFLSKSKTHAPSQIGTDRTKERRRGLSDLLRCFILQNLWQTWFENNMDNRFLCHVVWMHESSYCHDLYPEGQKLCIVQIFSIVDYRITGLLWQQFLMSNQRRSETRTPKCGGPRVFCLKRGLAERSHLVF